jgi:hypothetical protein
MKIAVEAAHLPANRPLERQLFDVDDRDVGAHLPSRRRDLAADPARSDHHGSASCCEVGAQSIGIGEGAQVVNAVQLGAGDSQSPNVCPRRQQQCVVAEDFAGSEDDLGLLDVHRNGARRKSQLDVVVGVVGLVVEEEPMSASLAAQPLFGQRHPVVGRHRLITDEQHAALESLLA